MQRRNRRNTDMPLLSHIKELRKVLLISACAIAIGTIGGWILSDLAYRFLAQPIAGISNVDFITTTPMEPVLVKLKISVVTGIVIALPIVLWQIWSFVLPALKKKEKKYLYLLVPFSILLFLGGAAFAYYFVLPAALKFMLFAGGGAVQSTPFVTKTSYLNFILTILLCFGLVFELPMVLLLLIGLGYLSPKTLVKNRKWAILIIVILVAILCPSPDLVTQLLMAGPMYALYEISIWIGYLMIRSKKKKLSQVTIKGEGM